MDKNKQVKKYLAGMKKERTRDEKKELTRRSKERKARGGQGRPQSEEGPDEDVGGFERMFSARDLPPGSRRPREPHDQVVVRPTDADVCSEGRIAGLGRGTATVLIEGVAVEASLAGDLAREQRHRVAVGDRCLVVPLGESSRRVVAVLDRSTRLSRPDPTSPTRGERVIAANIDLVIIVVSAKAPAFRRRLVDRFLVAASYGGAFPVVCVNKADLVPRPEERTFARDLFDNSRATGVPCLWTSTDTGEGVLALRTLSSRRCVVFVGQSGVGKSSLSNALDPAGGRITASVRDSDGKGRHTTTGSSLRRLDDGTEIIDTPGVRAFGLWNLRRPELRSWFPEFSGPAEHCRFRDCLHLNEPACGVLEAVAAGLLSSSRVETYHRILSTLE